MTEKAEKVKKVIQCCVQDDFPICEECPYRPIPQCGSVARKEILEVIEGLKNAPVVDMGSLRRVGWVPVTERLPEEEGRYLVYRPNRYFVIHVAKYRKGKWDRWDETETFECGAITHWMPLPEPPKE